MSGHLHAGLYLFLFRVAPIFVRTKSNLYESAKQKRSVELFPGGDYRYR